MKGHRQRTLTDDGSIKLVGEPRTEGFVIWFGTTRVKLPDVVQLR